MWGSKYPSSGLPRHASWPIADGSPPKALMASAMAMPDRSTCFRTAESKVPATARLPRYVVP